MTRNLYITHRIFKSINTIKKGGSDYIFDYFKNNRFFIVIESNLTDFSSIKEDIIVISLQKKKIKKIIYLHKSKHKGLLIKFLKEFFIINFFLFFKIKKINFAIVVNPINSFYIVFFYLLKRIKFKYFHIVDYTKDRFTNKLTNYVYLKFFIIAIYTSHKVGAVSMKIESLFNFKGKFIHMPNSPANRSFKPIDYDSKKFDLIFCVAEINDTINFDVIINAVHLLKKKIDIKILVTGNFINENFKLKLFKKLIDSNMKDNFDFIGFQNLDTLDYYLNYSKVGVVSYNKEKMLNYYLYADSLKIREYAFFSLPILSDDVFSTANEAEENKAGFIFNDHNEFYNLSLKLLTDKIFYNLISLNSKNWSNKNDKSIKLNQIDDEIMN